MKEKIIILILLIMAIDTRYVEHFKKDNKYRYKTRLDVVKGIFSVIYKSIMKIVYSPFSILSPTPVHIKGTKAPKCLTTHENSAGLCYKKCRANYEGKGLFCREVCPPGSKASDLSCLIRKSCKKVRKGETCKNVKQGKKTVRRCEPKYVNKCTGPTLKTKKSYGRGVGKIPNKCHDPDTYFLGLGCKEYGLFGKVKNRLYTLW